MKYYHNRPFPANIPKGELVYLERAKTRNLALFLCLGAPAILYSIKSSAVTLKDMFSIDLPLASGTSAPTSAQGSSVGGEGTSSAVREVHTDKNSSNINISFLLGYFNKKLPKWVKIFFKLLFLGMLLIKLLGFGYLEIFKNTTYLKYLCYISCSFGITYQLLNLYLLYKFSKNNIIVSEILPEFLQN